MPRAIWAPEAESDLEEIAFYIALDEIRPATADRIVHGVRDLCELIATQPEMGERHPELCAGCRVFPYKHRWIVLYRPVEDGIQVLRLVDGTRDYARLFLGN